MLPSERQHAILQEIEQSGRITVAEFAARIGVSGMTIRRDLLELENAGLVRRVHGGAVGPADPAGRRPTSPDRRTPMCTVGLIVPSATYYFPKFIAGAKAAAAEENVRLVLAVSDYQPEIEKQQIGRLLQLGVDGLIVTPADTAMNDEETYRLLARSPVPVMVMERSLAEAPGARELGGVRSDHAQGAVLALQHLVESGRKRLAFVAERTVTTDLVRDGFRRAMAELLPGVRVLEFDLDGAGGSPEQRRSAELVFERCVEADVDALLVLPDAAAITMADLATDRGIRVPDDLSIVAYDDETASLAALPLTAVSPPKFEVGAVALRMCAEMLTHRNRVGRLPAQAQITLLPSLIVRDSSSADPADPAGPR